MKYIYQGPVDFPAPFGRPEYPEEKVVFALFSLFFTMCYTILHYIL